MVLVRGFLVARPAIAEIMFLCNACFFKQLHGAVYRRDADITVNRRSALEQLLYVRWSLESESTRAITRRWPVIFSPFSAHFASMRDTVLGMLRSLLCYELI